MKLIACLTIAAVTVMTPFHAFADQSVSDHSYLLAQTNGLVAQNDGDDSYDPFADYSEFEEASDEEADLNFFRNGRFFTLGLQLGYQRLTDVMGEIYQPGTNFGGFLTYFFDMRLGLQVGYTAGDHAISLNTAAGNYNGTMNLTTTSFYLKYFLSSQNLTRGLSTVNPYFIGGFSQNYRTYRVDGTDAFSRDGAFGFDAGVGIEVPMMRNKMFVGLQLLYQIVNFSDENTELVFTDNSNTQIHTGIYPRGDVFSGSAILGINF